MTTLFDRRVDDNTPIEPAALALVDHVGRGTWVDPDPTTYTGSADADVARIPAGHYLRERLVDLAETWERGNRTEALDLIGVLRDTQRNHLGVKDMELLTCLRIVARADVEHLDGLLYACGEALASEQLPAVDALLEHLHHELGTRAWDDLLLVTSKPCPRCGDIGEVEATAGVHRQDPAHDTRPCPACPLGTGR